MKSHIQILKPLTSFRFVFALMVFASHLTFLEKSDSEKARWIYSTIFKEGFVAVGFFFVLSGFILAYNYESIFSNKNFSKKEFYIARIARIYPVHLLTFLIFIPLTIGIFNENLKLWLFQAITNATLTHSFFPYFNIYASFNIPSWSISNEMFFYLLFPFIILCNKWFKNSMFIFMVLILVPLLFVFIPEKFHHLFYVQPLIRIVDFILGIFLYRLFCFLKTKTYKINYNVLEMASVLLFVCFFAFHNSFPITPRYSFYYWIPISLILLVFSFQKGILSKLASHNFFVYLGKISFSFYMIHWVVMKYFKFFFEAKIQNEIIIIFINLFVSLGLSHLCFRFYEKPIGNWTKQKLNHIFVNSQKR